MTTFKALKESPSAAKYPHAYRWYKHVASYTNEFSALPGDPSAAVSTYGPEASAVTVNPKDAPKAAEEEEEEDLFGSDSEEEDPEAVRQREANLAAYKKKKEGKTKPAAKSVVTLEVKPWGECTRCAPRCPLMSLQTTRPTWRSWRRICARSRWTV